jgi:hypothetical protein
MAWLTLSSMNSARRISRTAAFAVEVSRRKTTPKNIFNGLFHTFKERYLSQSMPPSARYSQLVRTSASMAVAVGGMAVLHRRFYSESNHGRRWDVWRADTSNSGGGMSSEHETPPSNQNDGETKDPIDGDSKESTNDVTSAMMIGTIGFYKNFISPLLPPACRFVPTCSQYGVQAIKEFGPTKGVVLISWRLLRCSPIGGKGYDPPKWPVSDKV